MITIKRRPEAGQRFPFIPLAKAIDRARELYKVANMHEVPFGTAVGAWGYAEKSSGGSQTAAALKAFGLLEDIGGSEVRKVKLTEMATRIIRDPRDISPDRDSLIRTAALKPALHREILEKYKGMPPSDEALKAFLLIDRGLKDDAVSDLIREFAATMSFAKISESATIQDMEQEKVSIGDRVDAVVIKAEPPAVSTSSSVSQYATALPPFPAGVEMSEAKDQYNLAMYSVPEGSRIRISADLDLKGAKRLAKLLESRIKMMEEEEGAIN